MNALSYTEDVITVPIEETLEQICERYLAYNYHAKSYVWKDIDGRVLNMGLDLVHNELGDVLEDVDHLDIPEED